jgi:hypothetical protein
VETGEFRAAGTAKNQPVEQDKEVGCQDFHGLAEIGSGE